MIWVSWPLNGDVMSHCLSTDLPCSWYLLLLCCFNKMWGATPIYQNGSIYWLSVRKHNLQSTKLVATQDPPGFWNLVREMKAEGGLMLWLSPPVLFYACRSYDILTKCFFVYLLIALIVLDLPQFLNTHTHIPQDWTSAHEKSGARSSVGNYFTIVLQLDDHITHECTALKIPFWSSGVFVPFWVCPLLTFSTPQVC